MTTGVSLTTIHVALSLAAPAAGLIWLANLMRGLEQPLATGVFLATTLATSLTGFLFPFTVITPAFIFGVLSIAALAIACVALYGVRLGGSWRPIHVVAAMVAFYLNAFVAVVQSFQKLGPLQRVAPTQSEAPFVVAHVLLLIAFIGAGWVALKRVRPAPAVT